MSLVLIHPVPDEGWADMRLADVLSHALAGRQVRVIRRAEELNDLTGQRLLFAAALGEYGVNLELTRMLSALRRTPDLLSGATAGIIIDGLSPLYTKSTAGELALAANLAGCALVGRPLVEGAGQLHNFRIQAKNAGTDLLGAYRASAADLAQRVETAGFPPREKPELLVLHASSHHTSNTMALWERTKQHLGEDILCTEIGLRNGTLSDCSGCPYTMCLHFGERGGCFYGGVMQEAVYPALRRCAGVMMLCPNYNDALSANLTACVNRLTALFRQQRFYDKALFAIVVSGYSGGDIVARQLIDGLNMNKSFYLPARFAMIETANDPGEALALSGIESRVEAFAARIRQTLLFGTK